MRSRRWRPRSLSARWPCAASSTKLHEEVVRGAVPQVRDRFAARERAGGIKGEIVVVVDGPSAAEEAGERAQAEGAARTRAAELAAGGLRGKQIARALADEFGIARNKAYDLALEASRGRVEPGEKEMADRDEGPARSQGLSQGSGGEAASAALPGSCSVQGEGRTR